MYSGYSTDPAVQCACATTFMNWYTTSNPPTRTLTRDQPIGITTQTIVTGGSTVTTSFQYVTTEVFTVTMNIVGDDQFDYYGTAEPPCVSYPRIFLEGHKRLTINTVQLLYDCCSNG